MKYVILVLILLLHESLSLNSGFRFRFQKRLFENKKSQPDYGRIHFHTIDPRLTRALFDESKEFCNRSCDLQPASKGQYILKENCRALTSPKKQTNEFVFSIPTTLKYFKLKIKMQVSSSSESSG